ncbi:MAG: FAD-dependent oxidoreductase [Bacteroidales bacterium]|nr:FAD-dependent oxidoreductase [Bacteroidales bacterium]
MNNNTIILGAGISGLGAAYSLRQKGETPLVLEKDETYGGLCGCFTIDGFTFDRFVHLSFAKDERVLNIFNTSAKRIITHIPNPYNIYNRKWIKHPAQNNLYPLSAEEKSLIIKDFLSRPNNVEADKIDNYEQWLRIQFGNYFAEHFPMKYTKKYWMCEAKELETRWVGQRIYQPSVEEVIKGSQTADTPVTYYAKEMRYPASGGYRQFFSLLAEGTDIRYGKEVTNIDTTKKTVKTSDNTTYHFTRLISTLPLNLYPSLMPGMPEDIKEAARMLKATSGYHVSIALKTKDIPPYLWWYIYDEDILAARVYSPSLKSPNNAPEGCSSLQMEVYCAENAFTEQELKERTVGKLIEIGIIKEEDILFTHIGFEAYANVIFDKNIYVCREKVRKYLISKGIEPIGRFGEWGYLWSDQSLLSGLNVDNNDRQ